MQTFSDKIGNAPPILCCSAPCKLRDQQFRETKKDTGRKHQYREYHTADQAKVCQRISGQDVHGQPFGDHQVLGGIDSGLQHVSYSQRQRNIGEPFSDFNSFSGGRMLQYAKANQADQGQTGSQTAA